METMQDTLNQLRIKAQVVDVQNNGIMTKYFVRLGPSTKVDKLEKYSTEIALGLRAYSKPIIKPIIHLGLVSIEVLVKQQTNVLFENIIKNIDNQNIPAVLGQTHDGFDLVADITAMPHLLLAGETGSGKSVMLHSIICGILKSQKDIRLALIDPKMVELMYYKDVKQLLFPVVSDADSALKILDELIEEMEHRFALMLKKKVNNIGDYNKAGGKMQYILLVIDEFSDLMHSARKDFQSRITVLAQKSRACGIHIVLSTQRPSVDVVTGLIKANFPSRISCRVSSAVDSRVILDKVGAEKLLGNGDALLNSGAFNMVRFKGAYLGVDEIKNICDSNKRSGILNALKSVLW